MTSGVVSGIPGRREISLLTSDKPAATVLDKHLPAIDAQSSTSAALALCHRGKSPVRDT